MLINHSLFAVLLYREPCDMRKSIDGLSQLIASEFGCNPSDGRVYVFMNRERDKLKLLYWDKNGFCLWYKRLEREKFQLPKSKDQSLSITLEQLLWLLSGLDIEGLEGFKALKYQHFY